MYTPTPEEIAEFKQKHGEIFGMQFEDKYCILKKPDRKTLSAAMSIADKKPLEFNEMILNNCWVAGDEEIRKDTDYLLGAAQKLSELINIKEAELAKL